MTAAREQIIQTTCELLELQGYHATGLNQIIKESGSPKGSLYYYFPGGKEELTAESLHMVGQAVLHRIRENLAAIDDPTEAIRVFILRVAEAVETSGYRSGGPITTVAMETASSSERLREVCKSIYDAWQKAFSEKLLQSGFSEERADSLSTLILSAMEGAIILCRTRRSRQPLQDVAKEVSYFIKL
jgi:TetR/AcrR family transcriptional regulator, lmrAB and yxaGH operons repressor